MIITEALEFVESEAMKEHLRTTELPSAADYAILICESPMPIVKKIEALDSLIKKPVSFPNDRPMTVLKDAKRALKELSEPAPGSIFSLTYIERENDSLDWPIATPVSHYTSFRGVTAELRRRRKTYKGQLSSYIENEGMGEYKWAHVAQFGPITPEELASKPSKYDSRVHVKGVMLRRMDIILDIKANPIYIDVNLEYMEYLNRDPYTRLYDLEKPLLSGQDRRLHLTTPFNVGDIISLDMRPFFPVKHVVMLGPASEQENECTDEWGVFINNKDRVCACDVNFAPFYYNETPKRSQNFYDQSYRVMFNPLLRATLFDGDLPRHELILKRIADDLKRDPELAVRIRDTFSHYKGGFDKETFKQRLEALYD